MRLSMIKMRHILVHEIVLLYLVHGTSTLLVDISWYSRIISLHCCAYLYEALSYVLTWGIPTRGHIKNRKIFHTNKTAY
jgi:hypothetical protein